MPVSVESPAGADERVGGTPLVTTLLKLLVGGLQTLEDDYLPS